MRHICIVAHIKLIRTYMQCTCKLFKHSQVLCPTLCIECILHSTIEYTVPVSILLVYYWYIISILYFTH